MKKTLCILLALYGASLAPAASVSRNDYNYIGSNAELVLTDVAHFSADGDFALLIDLGCPLKDAGKVDFKIGFGEGSGGVGAHVSFSFDVDARQFLDMTNWVVIDAPYGVYSISCNGNLVMGALGADINASQLLLQIKDLFGENPLASASYYDANYTLTEMVTASISKTKVNDGEDRLPELLNTANVTVRTSSVPAVENEGLGVVTWKGEVTADDIKKNADFGIYWVNSNEEKELAKTESDDNFVSGVTKTIGMKGGLLVVDDELMSDVIISSKVNGATGGEVEIAENNKLSKSDIIAVQGREITLSGSGSYYLESGLELGEGILLGESENSLWRGTVYTGAVAAGTQPLDINALGTAQSTVQLGLTSDLIVGSLQADEVGMVRTPGNLLLVSGVSKVRGLAVNGGLFVGTVYGAATLETAGALSAQSITLGHLDSSIKAAELLGTELNVSMADSELRKLTGGSKTVLTLGKAFEGTTTLNGTTEGYSFDAKTIYTLVWEAPATGAAAETVLNLYANANPEYVSNRVSRTVASRNGYAGMRILGNAFTELNPQVSMPTGDLAGVMDTVDAGAMTDAALAAVAGSSVTVLGQALSGDVARQLRGIRNRAESGVTGSDVITVTTKDEKGNEMSTTSSKAHTYCVWVNAEGNRSEQDAAGTAAGYTLSSWGGTLGAAMKVNDRFTLGLGLTAMYGELKSKGPDYLDGDMDTAYLSAFAAYKSGAWNQSFIGTVGTMDADYKRTVNHVTNSYFTTGDTDGSAFGLMYELSREFALRGQSSISPVFNITYRHTDVDGYTERHSDAALSVDSQKLDTVTLGLGARYAATVGRRALNRECAVTARALAKYDLGDRQSDTMVGFAGRGYRANVESAKLGAFGVELGAGIDVPVGSGSIFADGAVELRSDYADFNATVGYKIQF